MADIPSELLRSSPRDVRLTPDGRAVIAAAAVLFIAAVSVGAFLYVVGERARAKAADAVGTQGRVVELHMSRGRNPRWIATYTYSADGRVYGGTGRISSRRTRPEVEIGGPVDVRYAASNPTESWIAGNQPNRTPIVLAPLTFVSLATIGALLLITVRRQASLLAIGRPAVALVTKTRKVAQSHGSTTQRLSLEYAVLSGARVTSHVDTKRRTPKVGSEILVIYDPDTPTRCARYPLGLVKPGDPMTR